MNTQLRNDSRYAAIYADFQTARMLPSTAYISADWFEIEKREIFEKGWVIVGRAEQIPNSGDFFSEKVVGQCVLLVRGRDAEIRAFSPSCRHRGALIAQGEGNARAFACPYHRWTYALDGKLIGAPGMEDNPHFRKEDFPLVEMGCTVWNGFIFVNLDGKAPALKQELGPLEEIVQPYNLASMRLARQKRYTIKANWKSYMDNSIEAYHVASVHARSLQPVAPMSAWHSEAHDTFYLQWSEFPGTLGVLLGEQGFPPMPGFSLDRPERHTLASLLPNTVLSMTVDACWWITLLPIDANTSTLVVNHAFPEGTRDNPLYDEIAERYFRRFDIVSQEDIEITEIQQLGLSSGRRIPGVYQKQELLVHAFSQYVLNKIGDQVIGVM